MSIPFVDKVNERNIGQSISQEQHLVGILATITYSPGNIRLIEVPQAPNPFSTVDIWSGSGHTGTHYNEITSGTPTGTQYLVDYTTGVISFSTSQDGNTVYVDYVGLGSEWAAEDVNEIQNPLSTVSTQVVTYNWPSAPTVSWKLADTVVKPASISTTATDDFTFPRDIVVTRHLTTLDLLSDSPNPASTGVIRLANNSDSISWRNFLNNGDLALTVNASNQLTFNGTPIELGTLTSAHLFVGNGSNIATDTAITGDVTISNTGVTTIGNATVTGTKIANTTITNVNLATGVFSAITGVGAQSQDLNMNNNSIMNVIELSGGLNPLDITTDGGNLNSTNISIHPGNVSSGVFTAGDLILRGGFFINTDNSASILLDGWTGPGGAPANVNINSGVGSSAGYIIFNNNGSETARFTFGHTLGIGTSSPDASALIDMTSTTHGFLPPRMTNTQRDAISSPATGLIIYSTTDNQWEGWNGSSWAILG